MTRKQRITVMYIAGMPMGDLINKFQMSRDDIEEAVDTTIAGQAVTDWKPSKFDAWLIPFEDKEKQEEGR